MSRNEIARNLRKLASRAYLHPWSGRVTDNVSEDEVTAFHRMKKIFNEKAMNDKQRGMLDDRYPFIKINGKWMVSIPKLYLYFFAARSIISTFQDEDMQAIYDGVQSASRYYNAAAEIDKKLTPHGHLNYEDYQIRLAQLYMEYQQEQLSIFGDCKPDTPVM